MAKWNYRVVIAWGIMHLFNLGSLAEASKVSSTYNQ